MAAELVGGAFLSATLQVAFERLASHDILDFFRGKNLKDDLLKKLHITLISINQVLEDAEERQYRNPNVKQWLDELKDAVYEADDLLDEIATEASRQKPEAECQSTTTKVRNFLPAFVNRIDKEIEPRINKVIENLEFLAKQKDLLGLKESFSADKKGGVGGKLSNKLPTTSLVDEASIYGRDVDKEEIIKFLLCDSVSRNQIPIITIVGMGGMGKTTLAQLVFNDQRMEDQFHLKAWVYVSEEFDVVGVTKAILKALHCQTKKSKDLNQLQLELKEKLMRKKFLLVLDDVWDGNRKRWELLLAPFKYGAPGSRIIVTTRHKKIASAIRSAQIHHLKRLEEEDCRKLFAKNAFSGRHRGADIDLNLIEIAAKKCGGLPLAIKTLGSLLYTKSSDQEWINVLESDIWNISEEESDIIPALRLSYHYLPSNLKRCFAYCSIFPRDCEISKDLLIQLWMAEGLLHSSQRDNKRIEEVGNEFFNDLESRSFFEQSREDSCYFIMHDLLNDLARSVSGEFGFRLEGDWTQDVPEKVRHFSFESSRVELERIHKCKHLRSFMPLGQWASTSISTKELKDLWSRFKYLRVLSLSEFTNVTEVADDICNLKHLRYLDLSSTSIRKLPDSFCMLINLQTLKLADCYFLTELPPDFHKLINLHHLDLCGASIKKMPMHIGRLRNLQILTSFVMGDHSGSDIKELGELSHLRGTLSISQLENIADPMDAMKANIKGKNFLEELELKWSENGEDSQRERHLLEAFQPNSNLKRLTVEHFGGTRFPDWFEAHYLPNLVSLQLSKSKYCFCLPPFGQLPSLKDLYIDGFSGIEVINLDFCGNCSSVVPFRSLEILEFEEMIALEEWICFEDKGFPCLQQLHIWNCPRLKKVVLPQHFPSLTLVISGFQDYEDAFSTSTGYQEFTVGRLPSSLTTASISGSHLVDSSRMQILFNAFQEVPHDSVSTVQEFGAGYSSLPFTSDLFSKIQNLALHSCENLDTFPVSLRNNPNVAIMSLTRLEIWGCPKFVSFPNGGLSAPKLESISLLDLGNLKSLPNNMHTLLPSLGSLTLWNCPQLESLPQGGLPLSLHDLSIKDCPKLIASRMEWGLHKLHSLREFQVSDDFENVESFPEEGLLPPNLQFVCFLECSNLKSINDKGLLHLKSLKQLSIFDCPSLHLTSEIGRLAKSVLVVEGVSHQVITHHIVTAGTNVVIPLQLPSGWNSGLTDER